VRIVSWNVENLAPHLAELPRIAAELGDPDILCLQEVRIRPSDLDLVERLRTALPGHDGHAALCDDPRNVRWRGGRAYGVATFVRASLGAPAAQAPAWDREGRVLVTAISGLSVVNLYAVNGTSKPYFDPTTGAPAGDRYQHKRRLQDRLFELAAGLRAMGGVVLAGDFNVSRARIDVHPRLRTEEPHARARAELNAHLERLGFVDAFRHLHPDERAYTWFARKPVLDAARVDYLVLSPDLLPRLRAATILDRRPESDHAPVAVELV
jgi:exodeoxyribonuclease-3